MFTTSSTHGNRMGRRMSIVRCASSIREQSDVLTHRLKMYSNAIDAVTAHLVHKSMTTGHIYTSELIPQFLKDGGLCVMLIVSQLLEADDRAGPGAQNRNRTSWSASLVVL